jgi:tRNA (uracil-5-)-methyltransferase
VLQGHVWKNKPIKVKKALPSADPLLRKRKCDLSVDVRDLPKLKDFKAELVETKLSEQTPAEKLNNIVTSLWKMPYCQQLQTKDELANKFMKELDQEIEKNNKLDKPWIYSQRCKNGGLCCTLRHIRPSPVIDGYRNKCEFTIGLNSEKNDNTVGFRLGNYKSGDLTVLEPTDCIHISSTVKSIVKELQKFLQTKSSRSSFNPPLKQGHWQTATVRTTRCGHTMLIVTFHPQNLTTDEVKKEKDMLFEYFKQLSDTQQLFLTSLYFQVMSDKQDMSNSCEVLCGMQYIEEHLLDMTFRISPTSFFQVNTYAAEVLYSSVAEMCKISDNTTLIDICCGTGTIGLTMAKKVKKVIGIELCPAAVDDAKVNAVINGVRNAEFFCGKAEELLPTFMRRLAGQEVVLIVDPPRAGLHSNVVRAIRRNPLVERLVYVSCKPSAARQNLVDLTRQASKRVVGVPFRLQESLPVDLFPHTELYELIMLLEREMPR